MIRLDHCLHSMILIRLGQELGTDSEIAQAVARAIDIAVSTATRLVGAC